MEEARVVENETGTPLVVEWLGIHLAMQGEHRFDPGQGLRSHISQNAKPCCVTTKLELWAVSHSSKSQPSSTTGTLTQPNR